ncbi:DUF3987 domain-containing protein [Formosa sp. PL04]|uniref:DUF3987 domain-containing protein n=1 Tax=Formosa sp. PL04 TaxID=3081755 RepID=UPI00298231CE|nr:DUF3987 domain-containing protein [Formosa sp. PL04]MDW5289202.1 DUF3987 domain-containing protein [Formosa sp. PL04]
MIDTQKNTSNIQENERSGLRISHKEDTKITSHIDVIDLENDYQKLNGKNKNPFPVDVFPKAVQEIIYEAHNKYQFCLDYLGAGVLTAASASIGNSYKVEVKKGWHEKVNLFTVIVGRPGDSKSHALNFCFKPIHEREDQFYKNYENELSEDKVSLKLTLLKKILISSFTPLFIIILILYIMIK